jgi:hypothetical protein
VENDGDDDDDEASEEDDDDAEDRVLEELYNMFKAKNGREPTEEEMKKWVETFIEASSDQQAADN